MTKIRTLKAFSGIPKYTTGTAERDKDLMKITWDLPRNKPLVDWFSIEEYRQYIEVIQ